MYFQNQGSVTYTSEGGFAVQRMRYLAVDYHSSSRARDFQEMCRGFCLEQMSPDRLGEQLMEWIRNKIPTRSMNLALVPSLLISEDGTYGHHGK